jgi:hypothetical protein
MFEDALLTCIVSQRNMQNSPLESSCFVVALIDNYSTSKPLRSSPEKSQILSCDNLVANERHVHEICIGLTATDKEGLTCPLCEKYFLITLWFQFLEPALHSFDLILNI